MKVAWDVAWYVTVAVLIYIGWRVVTETNVPIELWLPFAVLMVPWGVWETLARWGDRLLEYPRHGSNPRRPV